MTKYITGLENMRWQGDGEGPGGGEGTVSTDLDEFGVAGGESDHAGHRRTLPARCANSILRHILVRLPEPRSDKAYCRLGDYGA
jgi:hypothetical protein